MLSNDRQTKKGICGKLTLKIVFNSPELNRFVLFSLYFLRKSKKMDYFFETSYAEREEFPGSISIHFLSFIGMMLGELSTGSLLCGFAFAFKRPAKSSPSVVALVLQADLREFLCCCCLNQSQIYLIHEKFCPRIECCLHSETKF